MFDQLPLYPPDAVFDLTERFKRDPRPEKLNLGIGVFATEQGEPYVMPSVRHAVETYTAKNFAYLPIGGHPEFLQRTGELLFGTEWKSDTLVCQGTCGGTQAIALARTLAQAEGIQDLLLAEPTWVNHRTIFSDFTIHSWPHLNLLQEPNLAAYREQIAAVEKPSILLLHGGLTHNPTGRNLSLSDLKELIPLLRARPIFVFIDFAYWGLGDGLQEDAEGIRLLFSALNTVAVGVSFSKNATMYCHRVGALFIKTPRQERVQATIRRAVRTSISNPPAFGETILTRLFTESPSGWQRDLEAMRQSINHRRDALIECCPEAAALQNTHGLFGQLPLNQQQIERLRTEFAVYLPDDGRLNISGIRMDRLDDLAKAISEVKNTSS